MAQNTLQYILQKMHQGDIEPAQRFIDTFKVHNKKQRDELYLTCSKIQALCSLQAIPGGDEIAVTGYEKILDWAAQDKEASINLSVILMKWSSLIRARQILEPLYQKYPNDLRVNINLGTVYLKSNQLQESLEVFNRCVAMDPTNASCFNSLATILMKMKEDKLSIEYFKKTVSLDPLHNTAYMNLATLLHNYGHNQEAYKMAEVAAKISPSNPQAYFTIASMMFKDERLDESAEMCRIALQIDPGHSPSRQVLARILNIKGELEASQALLDQIQDHRKNDPGFYLAKLELDKQPLSEADRVRLDELINSNTLSTPSLGVAHLALARSAEMAKDYENEIFHLRKANEFKRIENKYRPGSIRSFVNMIINRFSKEFIEAQQSNDAENITPIFIMGPPRSGSTLTEQIISSHPAVSATGESGFVGIAVRHHDYMTRLNPGRVDSINLELYKSLAQDYLSQVEKSFPEAGAIFTDKSLFNFYHVALLKLCFPNAKFINCMRHPVDNSIGMYKQLFNDDFMGFTDDFDSIVEFYQAYQRIMEHWDNVLPGVVYHSQYETLVDNFEEEARKLISYCELPWDDSCLRFYENKREVRTASVLQVRQPIYKTAVAKWKRYEPYVQDLINKLNEAGIKM